MRRISLIIICIACSSVLACASLGNKQISDAKTVAKIHPGKSTETNVRALIGLPAKINFGKDNTEEWEYIYKRSQVRLATFIPIIGMFAGGADITGNTLTIIFDKKGIVEKIGSGKICGGGSHEVG